MPAAAPPTRKKRITKEALEGLAEIAGPVLLSYEGMRKHSIFGRFPRHTKLLGVISGLWGTLELSMGQLFEELLEPRNREARAVYYSLGNHRARRDILRTAGMTRLEHHPQLRSKLKTTINHISKRADRRNDLLHGAWLYFFQGETLLRYSPIPKGRKRPQIVFAEKESDLQAFAERLKNAIEQIQDLRFAVREINQTEIQPAQHAGQPHRNRQPRSLKDRQTPQSKSPELA